MNIWIQNANVISFGEQSSIRLNHDVYIENGLIREVFPHGKKTFEGDKTLDAENKWLMPGLVNAHTHAYSALVRGFGKAAPALDFQQQLENLWWKVDKSLNLEDCYYSGMVLALDSIRHGTTTVIDHHASPKAVKGSLNQLAKAFKQTGLRSCLCYELSDRDGEKISREGLEENIEFIHFCNENPSPFLKALFGMHASFTIEDSTMKKAVELSSKYGAGFHIHTAEAYSDQVATWKMSGKRVIRRLADLGVLGKNSITAHGIYLDDEEISLLAETGTMVVHNPQSNLNNAVGIADIVRLQQRGITVGLGTDAMTTNMLEEARVSLFAQHLKQNHPTCAFMDIINMLFINNYKIVERLFNVKAGKVEPGYTGDVILFDYDPPTPLDEGTLWGHMIYGFSQLPVDSTIVGGKVLMHNRRLQLDLDEKEVLNGARMSARGMWERFK